MYHILTELLTEGRYSKPEMVRRSLLADGSHIYNDLMHSYNLLQAIEKYLLTVSWIWYIQVKHCGFLSDLGRHFIQRLRDKLLNIGLPDF